jgi:SPFH domain / Band 7 family/PRC-barrel domain
LAITNYREAIDRVAQTSLREMIGSSMLASLLSDRKDADEQLKIEIGQKTAPWGIWVSSVEIRDVAIPVALQDAMSRQAQAEREKQARVILGSAEAAIAGKFVEAAAVYGGHPWALQLRAMNIIYETTKGRGATILMPSADSGRGVTTLTDNEYRGKLMLRNSQYLQGCAIAATDGVIGEVTDLYFDDEAWVIRYLVVSTGTWLSNRTALISPYSIGQPQLGRQLLPATLTKEQVKNSPDVDTDKPISRQYEMQYLRYYRYPSYWGSTGLWGVGVNPNCYRRIPGSTGPLTNTARPRWIGRQRRDVTTTIHTCAAAMRS